MIGIGIIGAGIIANTHIEAYLSFRSRCQILALCDTHGTKAETLKADYQLNLATAYTELEEMLKTPEIELVSICTPPFVHAGIAAACMRAGKHVLVEKPMAVSLEECDEMIRLRRETGCFLEVVSQNRYCEGNQKLKTILDSGVAGEIRFGQVESFWYRGASYYDVPWRGKWETEGGGCTLNHAVHQIDLLNWMMGSPKTVTAVLKNVAHHRAQTEDVSAAILTYENGALVTLTSSLAVHTEGQKLLFQCERAGLGVPWQIKSSISDANGFPVENTGFEKEIKKLYDSIPKLSYTGHRGTINHMLCLLERGSYAEEDLRQGAGGLDGRLALEVIGAIYQSGFTGKTVTLPLERDAFFYTRSGQEILSKERGLTI